MANNGFIFFLSVAFFALQVLLSPTLGASFSGRSIVLIQSPPFFASALVLLIMSFFPQKFSKKINVAFTLLMGAITIFVALIVIKFLLEWMSDFNNATHEYAQMQGSEPYLIYVMGILCLPQIFYFTTLVKAMEESSAASSTLVLELTGAAVGIICGSFLLEHSGWGSTAMFIFVSLFLGLAIFDRKKYLFLGTLVLLTCLVPLLEPVTNLRWAARWAISKNVQQSQITEVAHAWNTYSKVQVLNIKFPNRDTRIISIGDGSGTAKLSHNEKMPPPVSVGITAPLNPKKSLVLFAGAGAELFAFDQTIPGEKEVTGVEINKALIDLSLKDIEYGLPELLKKPGIRLVENDARNFLEETKEKYDLILYSWSGATTAYFSGAAIHTAKFAFTKEAFETAMNKLSENGFLVVLGVSKINVIATMKDSPVLAHYLKKGLLLLERQGQAEWKAGWDFHALFLKKGEITESEIALIQAKAAFYKYRPVISPFEVKPKYEKVAELLTNDDSGKVLSELNKATNLEFKSITDNRPFPFDVGSEEQIGVLKIFSIVLLVLSLGFFALLVKQGKEENKFKNGLVFFSLGLSGLFFQIFGVYKFIFLFGNPTMALSGAIGLSLLAGGIASYLNMKNWTTNKKIILCGTFGIIIWIGFFILSGNFSGVLFGVPSLLRMAIVLCFYLPAMVFVSIPFPYFLDQAKIRDGHIVKWFCLDAVGSALASGLTPVIVESTGINIFLVLGVIFFLMALLISQKRKTISGIEATGI